MLTTAGEKTLPGIPTVTIGGLQIAAIGRTQAAELMLVAAHGSTRGKRPLYFTSANGEVLARIDRNRDLGELFGAADQILADGQPLVIASRWLCRQTLPERVATTDLFHDVARLAEAGGQTFYLFGATEAENRKAAAVVEAAYPALAIVGRSHGFLTGDALAARLAEINALAPDILWLGLGVPREQTFIRDFADRLPDVGVIKTSGGLFNHLSGTNPRAPLWMQKAGLEWLWRMLIEPRRLAWRYITTNPRALYAILRHSS